jgi:hypothetical protein
VLNAVLRQQRLRGLKADSLKVGSDPSPRQNQPGIRDFRKKLSAVQATSRSGGGVLKADSLKVGSDPSPRQNQPGVRDFRKKLSAVQATSRSGGGVLKADSLKVGSDPSPPAKPAGDSGFQKKAECCSSHKPIWWRCIEGRRFESG